MKISVPRHFDENGYRGRSVSICFRDETFSEVLLITSASKEACKWKIPGGHIENGEMPEDAAVREMFEEAGIKGSISKFIGKYEDHNRKVKNFVYACVVASIEDQFDEAELNRERQWFPVEKAIECLREYKASQSQWLVDCYEYLCTLNSKFQDENEISNLELADAFEQMWQKKRYNEILFIADTCQAESLSLLLYSPNILGVSSSRVGEDSLSHHRDENIGVFVADRYSYYALEFLETITTASKAMLAEFLNVCPYERCHFHVTVRTDLYRRDPRAVLVTEFFSNVRECLLECTILRGIRLPTTSTTLVK